MANKNYCWSIGTTSFRTRQLNYKIERQLQLLEEFWNIYPDKNWNDAIQKETINNLNMIKNEHSPIQVLYYEFLKENNFLVGDATLRDKDARVKTSGLVDLGLINNNRRLTPVGYAIKNMLNLPDNKNNIFNISNVSYYYLLQFLKFQISTSAFKIKPFISLIYMIEKLDYLTYDEFAYLLPLCKNKNEVIEMVKYIEINRCGLSIDEIITLKLYEKDNYIKMLSYFLNQTEITEKTFEEIGMSGKSKSYDISYKDLYNVLKELTFDLKNLEDRIPKYKLLYDITGKLSGNASKFWKEYLFFGYRKSKIDKTFDEKFRKLDIVKCDNIIDFKREFFTKLHVIKWKVNLRDYFDLNRRYFSLTDIIKFKDNKIELDLLPKYYFKNIIDDLLNEELLSNKDYLLKLQRNIPIEEISNKYKLDINLVIDNINKELNTKLTINNINNYLESERLKEFNNLIDTKFSKEKILSLLDMIKIRNDKDINEYVTDNADIPTIFEYLVGISWYLISNRDGDILKYLNLSLDATLLPKTHAGGGMADIIYKYEEKSYPKHDLVVEVTLSEATNQRKMELESVPRHLAKNIIETNNQNNYALFVANELEESVILSMRGNKTTYYPMGNGEYIKGLKIIPIDIDILKKILINGIKYQDIYEWFKKAFDSKIEDPLWYQKEILEKI